MILKFYFGAKIGAYLSKNCTIIKDGYKRMGMARDGLVVVKRGIDQGRTLDVVYVCNGKYIKECGLLLLEIYMAIYYLLNLIWYW